MLKFKYVLSLLCIFMCKEALSQVTRQPTVPTTMPGPLTTAIPQRPINVGVLIPKSDPVLASQVGYDRSIGAIKVAIDRIKEERLLDGYNFTFQVRFDECEEDLSMGFAAELIQDYSVDLIIGPTCNTPALVVGALVKFFNVPAFTWGLTTSRTLNDLERFPTVVTSSGNSLALGRALVAVMKQFSWAQFAFIYSTDDQKRCSFIQNDIETAVDESSYDLYISFSRRVDNTSLESLKQVLLEGVKVARIFSMCFDSDSDKRTFFLAVHDLGLNTNDYVFILLELRNLQFNVPAVGNKSSESGTVQIWTDQRSKPDGKDSDALQGISKAFILDVSGDTTANLTSFRKRVIEEVQGWPFYCSECAQANGTSTFARHLADTFYLYGVALNKTITQMLSTNAAIQTLRLGQQIVDNAIGYSFVGLSGQVTIDSTGSRDSIFHLSGLTPTTSEVAYIEIRFEDRNWTVTPLYGGEAIWANRGGVQPSDQPKCGFDGTKCPVNVWAVYGVYIIIGGLIIIFLLVGTIGFFVQTRRNEIKRQNLLWQVQYLELQKPLTKSDPNFQSQRSFHSGKQSSSTQMTLESKKESRNYLYFYYHGDSVAARKFQARVGLMESDLAEIRAMCRIENENVEKFVGLCLDGPLLMAIWRFYDRGSIQDVIQKGSFAMDGVFMLSLIRDIANGLGFIHASNFLDCHGRLTSTVCLVDERWVVKVGDYGLGRLYDEEPMEIRQFLWMAPEHIRQGDNRGSKQGDIYSFAIICSEIVTRRPAWGYENNNEKLEDHIAKIKRGGENPIRPTLDMTEVTDLSSAVYHLIRDCWNENPRDRPAIGQVRNILRAMGGRNENLMDHVFKILEQYTTNLQQEVEERTKELMEEKKRSDALLYRMLPKQVADKLKTGSTVEPESYDSVTVFFSDICRFAEIASKCTPLQVINLLNDLFIMFDEIIETFDCYKVESVGDGTLVVSGLPRRNGIQHVKEISNMSLAFMDNVAKFRIIHLPNEVVQLRIGFHSGPCVAGVVGMTMPRYCLFGDTINTASRMESNGRPARIHLSADSNNLLQMVGGFKTEPRGEVIIKGKGVMETFWLISQDSSAGQINSNQTNKSTSNDPLYQQFLRSQK